jgi:hypothetical protein
VKSELAVLWQLDRETFNMIVKEASIKKREKYEKYRKPLIKFSEYLAVVVWHGRSLREDEDE